MLGMGSSDLPLLKIAITGGPCGGKTTDLVKSPPEIPKDCSESLIGQTYLANSDKTEERVRKRAKNNSPIYTHPQMLVSKCVHKGKRAYHPRSG
jgi:hypothetical protein